MARRCPSSSGQCIKRELFCDGQINCGGEEKDEQIEYCLKNRGGDLAMTIPIIILIVVFSIVGGYIIMLIVIVIIVGGYIVIVSIIIIPIIILNFVISIVG